MYFNKLFCCFCCYSIALDFALGPLLLSGPSPSPWLLLPVTVLLLLGSSLAALSGLSPDFALLMCAPSSLLLSLSVLPCLTNATSLLPFGSPLLSPLLLPSLQTSIAAADRLELLFSTHCPCCACWSHLKRSRLILLACLWSSLMFVLPVSQLGSNCLSTGSGGTLTSGQQGG